MTLQIKRNGSYSALVDLRNVIEETEAKPSWKQKEVMKKQESEQ